MKQVTESDIRARAEILQVRELFCPFELGSYLFGTICFLPTIYPCYCCTLEEADK